MRVFQRHGRASTTVWFQQLDFSKILGENFELHEYAAYYFE